MDRAGASTFLNNDDSEKPALAWTLARSSFNVSLLAQRKSDNRSVSEMVSAANRNPEVVANAPKIHGTELLGEVGLGELDRLYSHDPQRWTEADPRLLVETATL